MGGERSYRCWILLWQRCRSIPCRWEGILWVSRFYEYLGRFKSEAAHLKEKRHSSQWSTLVNAISTRQRQRQRACVIRPIDRSHSPGECRVPSYCGAKCSRISLTGTRPRVAAPECGGLIHAAGLTRPWSAQSPAVPGGETSVSVTGPE